MKLVNEKERKKIFNLKYYDRILRKNLRSVKKKKKKREIRDLQENINISKMLLLCVFTPLSRKEKKTNLFAFSIQVVHQM